MSGGYFNYRNGALCEEIFSQSAHYGLSKSKSQKARQENPLQDRDISELVFDVLCLLHSFDYWQSSDICEETYRNDVKLFKEKWFKERNDSELKKELRQDLKSYMEKLLKENGLK